jgi:FdhD protein
VKSAENPTEGENSRETPVDIFFEDSRESGLETLIVEEPLSIRIEGKPYSVVMRSPGEEKAHAAGFCLSEGLIEGAEDIREIGFCTEAGVNVATVSLQPKRREEVCGLLERKGFVSQTSCGICGKTLVSDLRQILQPAEAAIQVSARRILECAAMLSDHQVLHSRTRSAHAAMILDEKLQTLFFSEDVGRHNALDKAIGKALLANQLSSAQMAVMSSRLSYELVQKAARARIPLLIGISRPTALAVELARSVSMTLGCVKKRRVFIFCGRERVHA